jgi:hypothetical protein
VPTPTSRPAVDPAAVDPLTRELAGQRHRVVFTSDGGEPSLVFTGGQLRGYARTGRTADAAAVELRLGDPIERRPFLSEGLAVAPGVPVRIVPLHARGEREWFSVIEAPPEGGPWRVRLFERSGGSGKLLASHESHAHLSGTQIRSLHDHCGEVAVIPWGASLYAVIGGRVLVLDGPGDDAARFHETSDPDCPPNKRCYPLPAEIDAKRYLGLAPSGRSIVMAGEGTIVRRDVSTGATTRFGYQNFFFTGLVEETAVVLAHAGEPPFVKRWTPTGDGQLLANGASYVQLASTRDGTMYGVSHQGALDRLADGQTTPVVRLPPGHRVVAVAAADTVAFVVADDATPPTYAVVLADR